MKIIINPGEMSYKEALFFTFSIMNEIEKDMGKDCVIGTRGFGSAFVRYNKKSITVSTFPSINNNESSQKRLGELLNNFLEGIGNIK